MNKIILFLRTIVGYFIIFILGTICFIPCFIIASLPAKWRYDNRVYYWFTHLFYKGIVWATFLPVTIKGRENIPHEPVIFIANHQSSLDIPFLGLVVNGYPHIWLFLKKYTKVPLFGYIARRMNVVVDPSGLRKMIASIDEGLDLIQNKNRHLIIFPEGGRAVDGKIHTFFSGFAIIAKDTGRPVVPVMMKNLNKVYPPHSFLLYPYPVQIIIGKPFIFEKDESEEAFISRVRDWFVQHSAE